MPKALKVLLTLAVVGVLVYIVTSSMGLARVSCEVCMEFRGREVCRRASGTTRNEAIATARNNACAELANGRTENILCGGSEAASVTCSD